MGMDAYLLLKVKDRARFESYVRTELPRIASQLLGRFKNDHAAFDPSNEDPAALSAMIARISERTMKQLRGEPIEDDEVDNIASGTLPDGSVIHFTGQRWYGYDNAYDAQRNVLASLGSRIAEHCADPRGVFAFSDICEGARDSYDEIVFQLLGQDEVARFVSVASILPKPDEG